MNYKNSNNNNKNKGSIRKEGHKSEWYLEDHMNMWWIYLKLVI